MRDKKTIAIGIAGGIAILLATTIATACIRGCSADTGQESGAPAETAQRAQASEEDLASMEPAQAAMSVLSGNVWEAKGATLTVKDGRYVEAKGDERALSTFDIKQAVAQDGGYSLTIRVDATQAADAHDASITVAKDEKGAWTVASDEFSFAKTYTQSADSREPVRVLGMTDDLSGLVEGDAAGLTSAIQAYARLSVPGAKTATWTGEALIDCNRKSVTTAFSCDDSAKTLLTVTRDASGKYTVAG